MDNACFTVIVSSNVTTFSIFLIESGCKTVTPSPLLRGGEPGGCGGFNSKYFSMSIDNKCFLALAKCSTSFGAFDSCSSSLIFFSFFFVCVSSSSSSPSRIWESTDDLPMMMFEKIRRKPCARSQRRKYDAFVSVVSMSARARIMKEKRNKYFF